MYCKQCGKFFSGSEDKCPSCKQAEQVSNAIPTRRPRKKWKLLRIALLIFLLVLAGKHIYNNSGGYHIEGSVPRTMVYRGSLKKLVNDDYSLLDAFFNGNIDGEKNVSCIRCNDYVLEWYRLGRGGTVDLMDESITFFEDGLLEYNIDDHVPYDRFRDDFIFEIKDKNSSHTYYFQTLSDVATWLKKNF